MDHERVLPCLGQPTYSHSHDNPHLYVDAQPDPHGNQYLAANFNPLAYGYTLADGHSHAKQHPLA